MATNTRPKDPPHWFEGQSYEDWKKEVDVWKLVSKAEKKEEGPLVYRVLTGEPKNKINELTSAQIGSDTGLQLILDKLDELYELDKNQKICHILEAFEKFKRLPSMPMSVFLIEFEKRKAQLENNACKYPDAVLAYKLLVASNISPEQERLCKATAEWNYISIKTQIKKIICDYVADNPINTDRPIKLEPTLFTNSYQPYYVKENEDYSDFAGDEYSDDDIN